MARRSKEKICSDASVLAGAGQISSFDDETREAEVCSSIWDDLIESCLARAPWKFTFKQIQLNRTQDSPLYGFTNSYQLPPDMKRFISVERGRFEISGDKLFSNEESVMATYQYSPDPSAYTPGFVEYVKLTVASRLSTSLAEDAAKADMFTRDAEKAFIIAKSTDAQQTTTKKLRNTNFPLANRRW